ncbi:N-6 DNA methylase [Exiguobacterium mexicanum]
MKNILSEIVNFIENDIFLNLGIEKIDPKNFNARKNKVLRIWLGLLYAEKIQRRYGYNGKHLTLKEIEESFKNGNSLFFENEFNSTTLKEILKRYNSIDNVYFENMDVEKLYQELLNYEWGNTPEEKIVQTKGSRKRSGSYYTPASLSEISIDIQLEKLLENKDTSKAIEVIERTKVIDFSSGTGSYLISYVNSLKKIQSRRSLKLDFEKILKNIYAIDVDFIALQIAKIELCLSCNYSKSYLLNENFILGNPLLEPTSENLTDYEKNIYSAQGFIYHDKLALTFDNLKVFPKEGFDLILGNPPWEKIRLEEKSFFKPWSIEIGEANKKDIRTSLICGLKQTSPKLFAYYSEFKMQIESARRYIKTNFPLTGIGELNTYALFTELALRYRSNEGIIIYLVKSALVISPVYSVFLKKMLDEKLLHASYDFINTNRIFDIDSRERFVLLILKPESETIKFKTNLKLPSDIFKKNIEFDRDSLKLINPETNMLPNIKDEEDLVLIKKIYENNKIFSEQFFDVKFGRIVHFTTHALDISKEKNEFNIGVYEGKFIELFDGKYSTFEGISDNLKYASKANSKVMSSDNKIDYQKIPECRFFISNSRWDSLTKNYTQEFSLMWRSLTSATNRRTMIATILPHQPTSQSIQLLQTTNPSDLIYLLTVFNSIVFDYVVKLKLSGIDMTQAIVKQMPVPDKSLVNEKIDFDGIFASIMEHIESRVYKLYENDFRLANFNWRYTNIDVINSIYNSSRIKIIADLDLIVSYLYKINSEDFQKIVHHFNKFYTEDEIKYLFYENSFCQNKL